MPPKPTLPSVDMSLLDEDPKRGQQQHDEIDTVLESLLVKGQLLKKEAANILTRSIYFGNKIKDAVEKYREAADFFRTGSDERQAVECFYKALEQMEKKPKEYRAADKGEMYLEIGESLKEIGIRTSKDMEELEQVIELACNMFAEGGKFKKAAEIEKELARFLEEDAPHFEGGLEENFFYKKAVVHYKNAGELFETETSKSSFQQCFLKCGELYGLTDDYEQAMKYFELVAQSLATERLTAFNAREHLLRSFICKILQHLSVAEKDDLTGAMFAGLEDLRTCYDRYCEIQNVNLEGSLEGNMILKLLEAVQRRNPKELSQALKKFDKMKTLDSWKTTLLLKIKEAISVLDLT